MMLSKVATGRRTFLPILIGLALLGHFSAQASDQNDQSSSPVDSMGSQDPNLINPTNKQGYGRDVPYQLPAPKTTKAPSLQATVAPKPVELDIGEQTFQAALQLGVLVAVALLVGILFMINVGVEVLVDKAKEALTERLGRKRSPNIEELDPASLVGTFKRYK